MNKNEKGLFIDYVTHIKWVMGFSKVWQAIKPLNNVCVICDIGQVSKMSKIFVILLLNSPKKTTFKKINSEQCR